MIVFRNLTTRYNRPRAIRPILKSFLSTIFLKFLAFEFNRVNSFLSIANFYPWFLSSLLFFKSFIIFIQACAYRYVKLFSIRSIRVILHTHIYLEQTNFRNSFSFVVKRERKRREREREERRK